MKHIMQSLQASGKLQAVDLGAYMLHHPVWPNEPRFKLTVALQSNKMSTQYHLRAHIKFNGLVLLVVELCLLLLGGDQRGFGFRNKLLHMVDKRLCCLNPVHTIQLVCHSLNILAVTQLERRLACGHSNRRIDGKFNKQYFIYPLLIAVNGHTMQNLLNSAVCPFHLAIRL